LVDLVGLKGKKCRRRRVTNEKGESALSVYVAFTTKLSRVLLPIFLLKAREGRG
jgi:hypothetical protein